MLMDEREAQLELSLRARLPLVPLEPGGTKQLRATWRDDAPLSADEARTWVERGHNVGARLGAWVVVEGADSLPDSWVSVAGATRQVWLRVPGARVDTSRDRVGPGVTVWGLGSVCPVPGSSTREGDLIRWERSPADVACAPMPEEMVEALAVVPLMRAASQDLPEADLSKVEAGPDPLQFVGPVDSAILYDQAYHMAYRALVVTGGATADCRASLMRWNRRRRYPGIQAEMSKAFAMARDAFEERFPALAVDKRPVIWIEPDLSKTFDKLEKQLAKAFGPGHENALYQHVEKLVEPVLREDGSTAVLQVDERRLLELATAAGRWRTVGGSGRTLTRPSREILRAFAARKRWSFPAIEAAHALPIVRPDGTVMVEPGYCPKTRAVLLRARTWRDPRLRRRVKKADAKEAAQSLLEVVAEFPWVHKSGPSVALAMVLTLIGRRAFKGSAPIFAVRSHTPGTGKTLLVKVLGLIGTGYDPAMGLPEGALQRPRLQDAARLCEQLIVFDNERDAFGSPILSAAVTSGILSQEEREERRKPWAVRRMPWNTVVAVTGNNLDFAADTARRTIIMDIDCGVSEPESRTSFRYPRLLEHVRKKLKRYVVDALTILMAHANAKRPSKEGVKGFGGFEEWDEVVRQAIIWLGLPDPLEARAGGDDDLAHQLWHPFLAEWRKAYGSEALTTSELLARAHSRTLVYRTARHAVAPKKLTSNHLGIMLRMIEGRVFNRLRLIRVESHKSGHRWRVEEFDDEQMDTARKELQSYASSSREEAIEEYESERARRAAENRDQALKSKPT